MRINNGMEISRRKCEKNSIFRREDKDERHIIMLELWVIEKIQINSESKANREKKNRSSYRI